MKKNNKDDFAYLKTTLFTKTIAILLSSIFIIFLILKIIRGKFANVVVGFLEYFIYKDYDMALYTYEIFFRNNMELIIYISITLVFLFILRLYINSFTRYFTEINNGLDALLNDDIKQIKLSSQISNTERKLNSIKKEIVTQKMNAQLAEEKKNDLLVYLAHDLKTPLTSTIGYLTLLKDEDLPKGLIHKYADIALHKALHLEDLIQEFFEITRFNLSSVSLETQYINLSLMTEQILFEFKPLFQTKNIEYLADIDKDIYAVIDSAKMERVFDNILKNALNYAYENSVIELSLKKSEDNINIKVTNAGKTIPEDKLKRIFDKFYRLDSSRNSSTGGSGLGLAISKDIVEMHGGIIRASSSEEKICFEIILPSNKIVRNT